MYHICCISAIQPLLILESYYGLLFSFRIFCQDDFEWDTRLNQCCLRPFRPIVNRNDRSQSDVKEAGEGNDYTHKAVILKPLSVQVSPSESSNCRQDTMREMGFLDRRFVIIDTLTLLLCCYVYSYKESSRPKLGLSSALACPESAISCCDTRSIVAGQVEVRQPRTCTCTCMVVIMLRCLSQDFRSASRMEARKAIRKNE